MLGTRGIQEEGPGQGGGPLSHQLEQEGWVTPAVPGGQLQVWTGVETQAQSPVPGGHPKNAITRVPGRGQAGRWQELYPGPQYRGAGGRELKSRGKWQTRKLSTGEAKRGSPGRRTVWSILTSGPPAGMWAGAQFLGTTVGADQRRCGSLRCVAAF